MSGRVMVFGLGNPDRGDDGIGPLVADALRGKLPPGVEVHTRTGNLLTLVEDWEDADAVVCIDAAAPMGAPGRI
ncbi:MAG: hydrogenase maturation protease, partial [Candidatus Eremiobacteraeota bacterium]|nr:hydrogenase maturation protease [Candidatus Eremiobacteraeota bacterium]